MQPDDRKKTDSDEIEKLYTSGEFWDALPDFLASQAPNKIRFLMEFIDFDVILKKLPDKTFTIVDIGCGAGKVSTGLAVRLRERHADLDITVHGYDLSPQAIEVAKRENMDGEFVCGDFKDAGMTWDLALLIDIIEHIPEPDAFIRDVAERSRFFVVGFAMDDNLSNRLSKARWEATMKIGGHISPFNEKRATGLSEKYGKVLRASYIPNPLKRNLKITRVLHLLTILPRLLLQLLSRRLKGKVFGGESLYAFVESSIYPHIPSDAPGQKNDG